MEQPEGFGKTALSPEFRKGTALIWKRVNGELLTNVRWRVKHHSPSGFEIGYAGSGPADLALNAMAALFPISQSTVMRVSISCFKGYGEVSPEAWHVHQPFKFEFLVPADRNGGRIEWETLAAWLSQQEEKDAR